VTHALLTTGLGPRRAMFWPRLALAFGLAGAFAGASPASEPKAGSPATPAEARKTLDLAALPLMDQAERPSQRNLAGLVYTARGDVNGAFEFHRKQLIERKWTELPGGYVSDQAASASFRRDGFSLSLSVFPAGKPGLVSVTLNNHGNVAFGTLPVPSGAKPFYGGPVNLAYLAESPVAETAELCRKRLLEQGWQPYGRAGDTEFFKQNGVRLALRVTTAPAQGGKTVLDYSSLLMSVDLPAPAEAESLQYADSTTQLSFETKATGAEVVDFYRQALARSAWEATTKSANKLGFKEVLIFLNPQKDLLALELQDRDGKCQVRLKHQTAAEVAELDKRLDAGAERRKQENSKPLPKLALALPRDASNVKVARSGIEFNVGNSRAKPVVEAWRAQLLKDGWKERAVTLDPVAGSASFTKGNQHLTLIYSDVGFVPAEVSIQAIGVELERAIPGK